VAEVNRTKFPLNVHSEISMANEGISISTKRNIIIGFMVMFVAFLIYMVYRGLEGTPFALLGALVALIAGVGVSVFIYNHLIVNKMQESLEESRGNKIFKFFKISTVQGIDERVEEGVELSRYQSGEFFAVMTVSIGNITQSGELITEDFFDKLFLMCYKNKVGVKLFTLRECWEDSAVHLNYLKKLSRVHDHKLRSALSRIDAHQTKVCKNSTVNQMGFIFSASSADIKSIGKMVNYINQWAKVNINLSSMREIQWLTRLQAVETMCRWFGIQMIDMTPLADKAKVISLEIRKLVRPYLYDEFLSELSQRAINVDIMARRIKQSKNS
jgi:hypothetical protein